MVWNRG